MIYDILGRAVMQLVNDEQDIGYYRLQWDARDNLGDNLANGIYIYRMVAEGIHLLNHVR